MLRLRWCDSLLSNATSTVCQSTAQVWWLNRVLSTNASRIAKTKLTNHSTSTWTFPLVCMPSTTLRKTLTCQATWAWKSSMATTQRTSSDSSLEITTTLQAFVTSSETTTNNNADCKCNQSSLISLLKNHPSSEFPTHSHFVI